MSQHLKDDPKLENTQLVQTSLCPRQSFSILLKILSDNLFAHGDHMQTMYNNHHQN